MPSAALASTSAAISTRAARLAIVAIVSYQILLIALIFLRPDLAPSWHTTAPRKLCLHLLRLRHPLGKKRLRTQFSPR